MSIHKVCSNGQIRKIIFMDNTVIWSCFKEKMISHKGLQSYTFFCLNKNKKDTLNIKSHLCTCLHVRQATILILNIGTP